MAARTGIDAQGGMDSPGTDHLVPLRVPGRLAEIITEHAGTSPAR